MGKITGVYTCTVQLKVYNTYFYSKNKFEKLVHLVGFIIRIYHDERSHERQITSRSYISKVRKAQVQYANS
jgi:hypothetical protein